MPPGTAPDALPVDGSGAAVEPTTASWPVATPLAELERLHIARVMDAVSGNKSRAAEILGIGLSTLYRKLEQINR